jgi:mannose-6-phosphate isomerase-like protein (cupin superfamily)
MRTTLATLCALLFLGGCDRRHGPEAGAALDRAGNDPFTKTAAAGDAVDTALDWQPVPPALPPGARFALVEGDPGQSGPFRLRMELPDGYEVQPHYHPVSETIEVLEGTFLHGRGREWDEARLMPLVAGEAVHLAAGEPHFVRTRGRTVIEVRSTGPFGTTYVNPADDPQATATR